MIHLKLPTCRWRPALLVLLAIAALGLAAAPAVAANGATVDEASSSVPSGAFGGQSLYVAVRVTNTGSTVWPAGGAIRLGAQPNNTVDWSGWGSCGGYRNATTDARVFLCYSVYPGQSYTFNFTVTAPASGPAVLNVKMVHDGVEWFGEDYAWNVGLPAPLRIINGSSSSGVYSGLWVTHCLGNGSQLVWQVDSSREWASYKWTESSYDCGSAGSFGIYPLAFRTSTVQNGTWMSWCTGTGKDELVWQSNGSYVHAPFKWPQADVDGHCPVTGSSCGASLPGSWVWPVPSNHGIIQYFGNAISYQTCGFHTGLDIGGTYGTDIVAMGDGKVVYVGPMWYSGTGVGRGPYAIIIQHGPNFYTTYGHNQSALVQAGDCVTAGQHIAEMGDLGYSFGPHLHLEVVQGTPFTGDWQTPFNNACSHYVDPLNYISP